MPRDLASKLSNELRQESAAIPGQAVALIDDQANKTSYVVGEEFLFQGLEHDEVSRDRLLALLREGDAGPEVSREEGFVRMRAKIDQFNDKSV